MPDGLICCAISSSFSWYKVILALFNHHMQQLALCKVKYFSNLLHWQLQFTICQLGFKYYVASIYL